MLYYDGVVFDLDGVITKTAMAHALSWKETFDDYLSLRQQRDGEPFQEFSYEQDYRLCVDGRPRYKGVENFLQSRGLTLPMGTPQDPPGCETIYGLGNDKDARFKRILEERGVEVYTSTVQLVQDLKQQGVRVAVASSSQNCGPILKKTGLEELFEARIDGVVSAQLGLKGKPNGDIFLAAAQQIQCSPQRTVVVEDAVSGVQAGRQGGFSFVIGVAREGNARDLTKAGADVVVDDFLGVKAETIDQWIQERKFS